MSESDSDNESNRSESPLPKASPQEARSRSNTPDSRKSRSRSRSAASRSRSRSSHSRSHSKSRSRSHSKSKSRSQSHSKSKSRSRSRSKSKSRSRSHSKSKSRSRSHSKSKSRSRSHSKSKSRSRSHSKSPSGSKSNSVDRSRSPSKERSKSRSKSRSRSKSATRTKSRSKSVASSKFRSRSRSGESNRMEKSKSRSRSKSKSPERSRSPSRERSKSRLKSKSCSRSRSRSRSRSHSRSHAKSKSRSRSNSPNLEIDEPGSPNSDKGGNSDNEDKVKKKPALIDSDSEDEFGTAEDKGISAAAIFGDDADDISDDSDGEKGKSETEVPLRRSRSRSGSRSRSRSPEKRLSGDEEEGDVRRVGDDVEEEKENEPEPIPETRIDVEVPKINYDLGRDLNFVKLPNFLSVETRPFDPETYEDEIDEEETLDEEGRARLKLKVENTVRWRDVLDKEGDIKKESNARFVRWSDGSYSLHLGSEIFDVYRQPLQGDHNHMFIRQGTGLQGQAVFRTKLSFRPHSTESFTHRKMTLSLADRSQKTSGIKILSQVGVDPDNDRAERLKKEEEKLRRQNVRPKTARRKSDGASRAHTARDSFREEEGSDDEGAISISAIKNKYKGAAAAAAKAPIYSSDEDDSDLETRKGRKGDRATAALKDSDEDSDVASE